MTRQKNSTGTKTKTRFIMKGNPNGYYKKPTSVNFKPLKRHPLYNKLQDRVILPRLNKDLKFYTPTFIVPQLTLLNHQTLLEMHQKKVQESLSEKSQTEILLPKPRNKSKYCAVCRIKYQDYLQHIRGEMHSSSITKSAFQKYIGNLCHEFRRNNKIQEVVLTQKQLSLETKITEDQYSTVSLQIQQKRGNEELQSINLEQ